MLVGFYNSCKVPPENIRLQKSLTLSEKFYSVAYVIIDLSMQGVPNTCSYSHTPICVVEGCLFYTLVNDNSCSGANTQDVGGHTPQKN